MYEAELKGRLPSIRPEMVHRDEGIACKVLTISIAVLLMFSLSSPSGGRTIGRETPWLEPSLCRAADTGFSRFVSYIPTSMDAGDRRQLQVGALDDEPPKYGGYGCPAGVAHSTPQDFILDASTLVMTPGANVSLVVFRGEFDTMLLSFSLRDANGQVLLAEEGVRLGPPPVPMSEWAVPPPVKPPAPPAPPAQWVSGAGGADSASTGGVVPPARRLLYPSAAAVGGAEGGEVHIPGSRRLLKGGASSTGHYYHTTGGGGDGE